jgi:hypothetical protein
MLLLLLLLLLLVKEVLPHAVACTQRVHRRRQRPGVPRRPHLRRLSAHRTTPGVKTCLP